jgi:putative ABC transport system permease protein
MFRNYVKTAFRNILKHKSFSFINIIGLAIGIAACLLMIMYVLQETSFDNFQKNKDRIYRVSVEWGSAGNTAIFAGSLPAIAPALNENSPEVEAAARLRVDEDAVIISDSKQEIREENSYYSDPKIFDILSFDLMKGDKESVLTKPFEIVLSETTARKYFGNESPISQSLNLNGNLYTIVGIFKDLPENSHLACNILISYSSLAALGMASQHPWNEWGNDMTYILLKENADVQTVHSQLNKLFSDNAGQWLAERMKFHFDSLSRIHWLKDYRGDIGPKGNLENVYIFLVTSILILLIACFNFVNLSLFKNFENLKNIGIRKVAGARKSQIIMQFLTESLITTVVAVLLGCAFFEVLSNQFYLLLGTSVSFEILQLIIVLATIVLFVGISAGIYPALYISKFEPVLIVKGNLTNLRSKNSIRKFLTVFQFTISIILVIGSLIIFQQINFMKNTDLGFDKNDILMMNFPINSKNGQEKYNLLKESLDKQSGVTNVSGAYTLPGTNSMFRSSIRLIDTPIDESQTMQCLKVDYGFLDGMNIDLIQGSNFSPENSGEANETVILNESAVKALNLENPIGTITTEGKVIGVAKDFHITSMQQEIKPLYLKIDPSSFIFLMIKINSENQQKTIEAIKETWSSILPEYRFSYVLMEDAYNNYYRNEEKTNKLISIFTILAIFVSCLGLLGLISFTTIKRTKEIGIRKVIGATSRSVVFLLIKDFGRWMILANIFAWPIAWFIMSKWLQNYAYHINISLLTFFVAGFAAVVVALAFVSIQTFKAANANPVKALKYE